MDEEWIPMGKPGRQLAVVSCLPKSGPTGVQTHFGSILERAAAWGWETDFVSPYAAPWRRLVTIPGSRFLPYISDEAASLWLRHGFERLLTTELSRRIRERRTPSTVVYAQDTPSVAAALRVRNVHPRVKVVAVVHTNTSEVNERLATGKVRSDGPVIRYVDRRERARVRDTDLVIFPSHWSERVQRQRFGSDFTAPSAVLRHIVEDPGPTQETPSLDAITIGSLEPRKNHRFLLLVWEALAKTGFDFRLTIVGDGPLREKLERDAKAVGVDHLVHFAGRCVPAAPLIGRHRVYVHAAHEENSPLVVVEALARGRPVFAGPVGGIPELIEHGREGFLWSLDDPVAAARSLSRCLSSERRYEQLSVSARKRFEREFAPGLLEEQWKASLAADN